MAILKLKPACKDYLWGGRRLIDEFHKEYEGDVLAETWELSCHPDGPSIIENGPHRGKTLKEYLDEKGMEILGTNCRRFREFPILTKLIDARDNLSIQVHPSNGYALQTEGQYGKTEMWYVLDAEPGAYLYYGFRKEISLQEFAERIENDTLLEVLNPVEVHKGDALFIESGTLHAIGKGILIAEIQQNSNITYRVYDYGRVGKDGKKRDLHIEKALAVTSRVPISAKGENYPHVADCDYFTVDKLDLDGRLTRRMSGTVGQESFLSILILDGEGTVANGMESVPFCKGDSIFLEAGSGEYTVEGTCDALLTTIRRKASPVRAGIILGSMNVQIGLLDDQNRIIAEKTCPADRKAAASECVRKAAEETLRLLADSGISPDRCTGAGIGVPGTVERRLGKVIYSNNLGWKDVPVKEEFSRIVPVPVRIANDADCAALGEATAGSGREYSDIVMLTLGNGVGGGIILNGKVFEGGMTGGGEIGHMTVRSGGRKCTCGRKGCLEAYVSLPALLKDASRRKGRPVTLEEIFGKENDPDMEEVLRKYTEMLGEGIVNIVNVFRPQLIILGGMMSKYTDRLIPQLTEIMKRGCFGGADGMIPEIRTTVLKDRAGMVGAAGL